MIMDPRIASMLEIVIDPDMYAEIVTDITNTALSTCTKDSEALIYVGILREIFIASTCVIINTHMRDCSKSECIEGVLEHLDVDLKVEVSHGLDRYSKKDKGKHKHKHKHKETHNERIAREILKELDTLGGGK